MNNDEFAFFNQQLAAMLRDGIPLEGALKQLASGMRVGPLRAELELLETDLARGTPLADALAKRSLPELYRRMVIAGARSENLPGMLTLLADHYHRNNLLWTRLKGVMVYPVLVILVSLALSLVISMVFRHFLVSFFAQFQVPTVLLASMWVPPCVLAVMGLLGVAALSLPGWRAGLRWRLPAFREASLAQLASAMALMLRSGVTLAEALALAESMESASPAGHALAYWRSLVERGSGKPTQWGGSARPFPPLFLWLVQKGGEDVAAGFQKAADIFQARAAYRAELLLYGALPVSILFLGQMIFWQVAPLMDTMRRLMDSLGGP
jgi:type II secretory pathway component PulF